MSHLISIFVFSIGNWLEKIKMSVLEHLYYHRVGQRMYMSWKIIWEVLGLKCVMHTCSIQ